MALNYREIDFEAVEDCRLLAWWYNDPQIKHLYSLFPDEESASVEFTPEYFERIGKLPHNEAPHQNLMVLADDVPIGQAMFETDTPKLLTKQPNTAWLALMIGEREYRECGLGKVIAQHLEGLAAVSGAQRIEIGVFEHNERALRFFSDSGYGPFQRRKARTWYNGRMWDEIRLLKSL